MKTYKLYEIADSENIYTSHFVKLFNEIQSELKIDHQRLTFTDWEKTDKNQLVKSNNSLFPIIKVDPHISDLIIQKLTSLDNQVFITQALDALELSVYNFLPRLLIVDVLSKLSVSRIGKMDIAKPVFVVGCDGYSKAAIGFALSSGYAECILVYQDRKRAEKIKKQILARYHGCEIHLLEEADLTLSNKEASLLLNCTNLSKNEALLTDLAYFNFMAKESTIIDLCYSSVHDYLEQEAGKANLNFISPVDVYSCFYSMIYNLIVTSKSDCEFEAKFKKDFLEKYKNDLKQNHT